MAAPEIADLDPDERDIVSVVHDWVNASVRPVARDLEHDNTYPGELIEAMKRLGIFGQDQFRYDQERDVYVCPQGEELHHRHTVKDRERNKTFKVYATKACSGCPLRPQCTTSRQGRRIKRWVDQGVIDRLQQRNRGQPELLKQRKLLAEHPFGTIKRAMNQGYFLLKGLKQVGTETGLTVLSYNLKRVLNIMGVEKMISSMETTKAWST